VSPQTNEDHGIVKEKVAIDRLRNRMLLERRISISHGTGSRRSVSTTCPFINCYTIMWKTSGLIVLKHNRI